MFPNARMLYEQEAQPNRVEGFVPVSKGVVGWEHADEHHDLGTDSNDGHSFVRVTLFKGKELSPEEANDGNAHGAEILCKVMGPLYWVPPKGTPVLVAAPDGEWGAPGSAVILGSIGPSPGIQFKGTKPKLDFGPDQDLVIKAKTLTLSDYNDNFIFLGPVGIKIQNKDGSGGLISGSDVQWWAASGSPPDCKAILSLKSSSIKLMLKEQGYVTIDSTGTVVFGKAASLYGNIVTLGQPGLGSGYSVVLTKTAPTGIVPIPAPPTNIFGATNVFVTIPSF